MWLLYQNSPRGQSLSCRKPFYFTYHAGIGIVLENPKKHCTIHKRKPLCIVCIVINISVLLLSWNIDVKRNFAPSEFIKWILSKMCIKYTQSHLPRFTSTMLRGRNAATDEDPRMVRLSSAGLLVLLLESIRPTPPPSLFPSEKHSKVLGNTFQTQATGLGYWLVYSLQSKPGQRDSCWHSLQGNWTLFPLG